MPAVLCTTILMMTVLKIRSEFGLPRRMLTDPERYIDERYLEAARGR